MREGRRGKKKQEREKNKKNENQESYAGVLEGKSMTIVKGTYTC